MRWLIIALALALSGCQSAYYAAWEKLGVEKRDILVDRVEDARETQQDAQEQLRKLAEVYAPRGTQYGSGARLITRQCAVSQA